MNRRERRALERKGQIPKSEPAYVMKPSDIKKTILDGVGDQILKQEIRQRYLEMDKKYALDMDTVYLWTLHVKHGWGREKLKKFYLDAFKEHLRMREFYEMDDMYPERYKLKEKGIDIEAWYNQLFDGEGNFKKPEEVQL